MNKFLISMVTVAFAAVTINSFAQNPLLIPPVLSGTTFNLNINSGSTEFFAGHQTPTYGFNGNILGPTLIMNKWDLVSINVTNNLPTITTVHWHGLHVPPNADGGPHQMIMQGATWSPSFTVLNNAGTYWYHPHGQNRTDIQVSKGLAGMIIIRDSAESNLDLPRTYGVDDFPLIVQTKCFDVLYQTAIATVFDTVPMVNATINPFLNVPAQVVRLRLLNGASDRSFMFGFSNNMDFHIIATDGGLLESPVVLNRLRLSPGERAEILIDLSTLQGQSISLKNYGSQLPDGIIGAAIVGNAMAQIPEYDLNFLNGADYDLLQLNVSAPNSNPVTAIPSVLVPLSLFDTTVVDRVRSMVFAPQNMGMQDMVEGPFTMNGHQFSMDTINDTTYIDNVEKWVLDNQTLIAHPFHIHDVQFLITDINGGNVPAFEQGWKDVVLVMPQQTVTFITKFTDFSDTIPYMYHCHLLHHEDDGMMGSFVVLPGTNDIKEIKEKEITFVFPNPGTEEIEYKSSGIVKSFDITNTLGKKVIVTYSNLNNLKINISTLKKGIYFLNVQSQDNTISHVKFIKD